MKLLPSTPAERRRQLWLAAFLVVAAGLAYWMQRAPEAPSAAGTTAAPAEAAAGALPLPVPDEVRLTKLEDVRVLSEAGRKQFA